MPLYEYQCVKCGKKTEKIEPVAGPHLKKCPHCGGKVEQTLTAPAIQFKGSGWYVTDYAGKSSAKDGVSAGTSSNDSKDSSSKASAKENGSKETKESKESKESQDSKDSKDSKSSKKNK